uniref:Interleukin 12 receptor, beta 2a n=1 Tax=Neogobius melanostomus TaxID=47308 RepID=A0A8C6TJ67_9GOBI
MRTMKPLKSIFIALLFLQLSSGDRVCEIWSSAGEKVHRTSKFRVYCTFNFECSFAMYSGHPPSAQHPQKLNATTIYLEVANLTELDTFSCDCKETIVNKPDSCGLDIEAGYPPDVPTNVSCIFKVADQLPKGVCSWNSGRNTYLKNNSTLCLRTFTHNASEGTQHCIVSAKGSASFPVGSSVQLISVWIHVSNPLGSAVSPVINYTLSDILTPDPPVLDIVNSSSRNCSIKVTQRLPTLHLDVYYKENNKEEWTLCSDLVESNGSVLVRSLLPFRLYHFRARSRFGTGLWSDWSRSVSSWTQEEAPARALNVWYATDHNEKSMRVYWKALDSSSAQGKILEYIITVHGQSSTQTLIARSNKQSLSVPCTKCNVTVSARNSGGRSPPANIAIRTTTAEPPLEPVIKHNNVTICWRKFRTAPLPLEYVVEWLARGDRLEKLRWVRLGRNSSHVVITDMREKMCYEGAVYVFYSNNSVGRHMFTGVDLNVSIPTEGPPVEERTEGNRVNVTVFELPFDKRMGCITNYTIYLENNAGRVTAYNISASQRFWVSSDLPPAAYSIWMTASTAKGESKPGPKKKFFISPPSQMPLILTCGTLLIFGVLLLSCACQSSAVKERVWVYFQYCRPDDIPDPANSKWAKECLQEKGKVSLQLQLSTSTVSEEEDLVLVDVLERPRPLLCPQTSLNSDSEPSTPLYPHTAYIKSLSHDSYSSGDTQTSSLDINETIEYISSHGAAVFSEEEGDNMEDVPCFFPSHSFSMEPMDFGPKLTLDAVRIDGTDFFLQCDT